MSQEGLGFAAGLHRNYVGALERGEINPTLRTMVRLVRGLGLPLSEIVAVYERHLRGDVA
jgi:transcriptional regulator with XRE-family HTH domain